MKIALFVDFDNVYSGLRRISAEAAERFSRQPLRWLQWLTTTLNESVGEVGERHATARRRVLVRRCYLNPVVYQKYRRPFHEAGFEIVDCPPMTATGKTSTDIHLVLDTMDALADATHFDEFIVFSADADFSPVLRRLRRHDRRTVVFAAGAMSESYKASADHVINIQTFLQDALQLQPVEDEEPPFSQLSAQSTAHVIDSLRSRVADRIREIVLRADQPVALPAIAQQLGREFVGLRADRWDGAGSFSAMLRELQVPDVKFDFQGDVAIDQRRSGGWVAPVEPLVPLAVRADASVPEPTAGEAASDLLTPQALNKAAEAVVRRAVAHSKGPLHLSTLGQMLREELPQLRVGWSGAPTLAAFLQQLTLDPLQRAVLENGTTYVLYDPTRHEAPSGIIRDRLVVGMLRAAELPEMKGADMVHILTAARPFMGKPESFEITEVSRSVAATMTAEGQPISPRRVTAVLQAIIFGGLDTTKAYAQAQELIVDAMGVILSAWAREMQAQPDDDARARLIAWMS